MSESENKKGISFTSNSEVSAEAKLKIEKLVNVKRERLSRLVENFNSGKYIAQ